jgi:hypothetical protein
MGISNLADRLTAVTDYQNQALAFTFLPFGDV